MKRLLALFLIVGFVSLLSAEIGWSGNIYPNSESFHISNENITVYYQIWKDGVTNLPGQGENISAKLFYKLSDEDQFVEIDMPYLGEVGNNDEYSVDISEIYFEEDDIINFYCEGFDASDSTYSYGTDQNNNGPFDADNPGIYYIGSPTAQDVTVTFQVNMSMVTQVTQVSVAGTFNDWTAGSDILQDPDMDNIYTGEILFPAGSNPNHEYKFVNGDQFEDQIDNRILEIDDSSSTQVLDVVYFNNLNPDDFLSQDVMVTFNVDVSDSASAGAVFDSLGINGNVVPLDWDFALLNNPLINSGNDIWTIDITFPEGSWIYLEFKFARNGNDWEADFGENHTVTLDDSSPTMEVNCTYGEMGPVTDTEENTISPVNVRLNNFPNPFNPSTTINFSTTESTEDTELVIYNLKGQKIRQFPNLNNRSSIIWDGKDKNNKPVSSGVYFYQLKTGEQQITKKMMLLK